MGGLSLLASLDLSMFAPVSPPAESIRTLTYLVSAICLGILLLVWGILFYSLFRFRRGQTTDGTEPPQVYGSQPIEIAWTAAPALVVFLLCLAIIRSVLEVRVNPDTPPEGSKPLYVTVIGHQWWWEYVFDRYDGQDLGGVITANELHIPASDDGVRRPVYLTLKSADVCHSYWVPRLAGKTDLIPGRVNQMWFQTATPGLFLGQCAEYCGTQHANMLLRVYVDSPDEFARWLANEQKPAVDNPAVRKGRETFLSESCINCHRVRGTRARGDYAPDLTHLMSRRTLASGILENNRENLRRWVKDPQTIKPGCLMPAFGLGEQQVDAIVDYLLTLH
jgi:cytochrome c oxidase subunit 2